jgi:hypothetical protein
MWKKTLFIAGGVAVAVALPMAALAVTTGSDDVDDAAVVYVDAEATAVEAAAAPDTTYEPRRLRVHAETGPPEGFEPVQLRIHKGDVAQARGENMNAERGTCDGQHQALQQADGTRGPGQHQATGAGRNQGNADAPMADCTGDCVNELGRVGSGPRGPARNSG